VDRGAADTGKSGFHSVVAIAKTAWVLERSYRVSDQDIAAAIERLLQTDVLVVENEQQVFAAMITLKKDQGSFADALIAALGVKAGCSSTLTFDRRAFACRDSNLPSSLPPSPRGEL
jgi:predicted nucleic-acid-binding protein